MGVAPVPAMLVVVAVEFLCRSSTPFFNVDNRKMILKSECPVLAVFPGRSNDIVIDDGEFMIVVDPVYEFTIFIDHKIFVKSTKIFEKFLGNEQRLVAATTGPNVESCKPL